MTLRIAAPDLSDTPQVRALWEYCFDDSPEFVDFFFQNRYAPENTLAVFDGGKLASCLQFLPYTLRIRGRSLPCPYIVGVSTWPEYRGRGLIRRLLSATLDQLNNRDISFSVLLPFSYPFYRKYGWEICYEQTMYHDFLTEPAPQTGGGTFHQIDPKKDIHSLACCYEQYMKPYQGYVKRTGADWQRFLEDLRLDQGAGWFFQGEDGVSGYVLFTITERVLMIRELAYNHPEVRERLLALAASHLGGQADRITMRAPADDLGHLSMQAPVGAVAREVYCMSRIHRIQGLEGMAAHMPKDLLLGIRDPFYNGNQGVYRMYTEGGMLRIAPYDGAADSEISIQTLSQLFWGYIGADQALRTGLIAGCHPQIGAEALDWLFPKGVPYILEAY